MGGRDVRVRQSRAAKYAQTFIPSHSLTYIHTYRTEPLPDPTKFTKRVGEGEKHAARRRNADVEAEYNAVTCVALYLQLMSFSQKGIDRLRVYQEHAAMRCAPGEEVVLTPGFDIGSSIYFHTVDVVDFGS